MKHGAYDYLIKPFERKELSRVVSEALIVNRADERNGQFS
jgi:FixJ family two-component response regulator